MKRTLACLMLALTAPAWSATLSVGTPAAWAAARPVAGDTVLVTADMALPCDTACLPGVVYDLGGKTISLPLYGSGPGPYRGLLLNSNVTLKNGTIRGGWWGAYSGYSVKNVTVQDITFDQCKCALKIGAWSGATPNEGITLRNLRINTVNDPWTIIDIGPGSVKGLLVENVWSGATITADANSTSSDGIAVECALDTPVFRNVHIDGATGDGLDVKGAAIFEDVTLINVRRNGLKAWGLKDTPSRFLRCAVLGTGYNSMCNAGNVEITDSYFEGGTLDSSAFAFGANKVYDPNAVDQFGHPNTYGAGGVVARVTNTSFIRRAGTANLLTAEANVVPKADVVFTNCQFWNPTHPNLYVGPPQSIVYPKTGMTNWPVNFITCTYNDKPAPVVWTKGTVTLPPEPPKPPAWALTEAEWQALVARTSALEAADKALDARMTAAGSALQ